MTALAPVLQRFFITRLTAQYGASVHTIAAYRDTWRLLLRYAATATGTPPAMLELSQLDSDLITTLAHRLPVPLVLHGSSGVSDEGMRDAIRAGMTKINVSTHLNKIFTTTVRDFLAEHRDVVDSRKWFSAGSAAMTDEVERLLRWYRQL